LLLFEFSTSDLLTGWRRIFHLIICIL